MTNKKIKKIIKKEVKKQMSKHLEVLHKKEFPQNIKDYSLKG